MKKYITDYFIANQKWCIFLADSHDPELMVDGTHCLGTTWPARLEIYVSNELCGDRLKRTIRHELAHAFIASTQMVRPESYTEEDLCEFMAIYAEGLARCADEIDKSVTGGVVQV